MKTNHKKIALIIPLVVILGAFLFLGSCALLGLGGPFRETNTYTGGSGGDILDNTTNDFTLEVTATGDLYQVRGVKLTDLQHAYAADLEVFLVTPGGSEVILFKDQGLDYDFNGDYTVKGAWYSDDNFAYYELGDFSDDDSVSIGFWDGYGSTSILSGTYYFEFTNYNFDESGESINGTWTLRIVDDSSLDAGSITGWELIVNHYEPE